MRYIDDQIIESVFQNVLSNWPTISADPNTMAGLDVGSNKLCLELKRVSPDDTDLIIQAKAYSMMVCLLIMLCE